MVSKRYKRGKSPGVVGGKARETARKRGAALAFGLLIVFLVIAGSCWIIANLNANLMA